MKVGVGHNKVSCVETAQGMHCSESYVVSVDTSERVIDGLKYDGKPLDVRSCRPMT